MSLLPVKFAPLETDIGESEPEQPEDGRDDGGDYYEEEYQYQYPYNDYDDDNLNGHRDAVPLVGSSPLVGETLVDPERRAICWPVYLTVALCIGLLTAAVVLIPPADETGNTTTPSAMPSASPSMM